MGDALNVTVGPNGAVEITDFDRRFGVSVSAPQAAIAGRKLLTAAAIQSMEGSERIIGITLDDAMALEVGFGLTGWDVSVRPHTGDIVLSLRGLAGIELRFAMDDAIAKAMAAQLADPALGSIGPTTRVQ